MTAIPLSLCPSLGRARVLARSSFQAQFRSFYPGTCLYHPLCDRTSRNASTWLERVEVFNLLAKSDKDHFSFSVCKLERKLPKSTKTTFESFLYLSQSFMSSFVSVPSSSKTLLLSNLSCKTCFLFEIRLTSNKLFGADLHSTGFNIGVNFTVTQFQYIETERWNYGKTNKTYFIKKEEEERKKKEARP